MARESPVADPAPAARPLVPTLVPGLDELLAGGLPAAASVLIAGEPGTGKTVLCSQIAFGQASAGVPAVFATLTAESHDKLLLDLRGFAFFDPAPIGEKLLFVSLYPAAKQGAREARDLLLTTVRRTGARLLVIDGLRALRALLEEEAAFRDVLYEVSVGLFALGCTLLATVEHAIEQVLVLPEATTLDGLIVLSRDQRGPASQRRIEVVKIRGVGHVGGRHTMRLDASGVHVMPRLEAVPRLDRAFVPTGARASSGVIGLDDLLHGGLPERTTTLVAGSTGIGKTLLGLQFAAAGARHGEKALFFSFNEPVGSLVARARGIGLELDPLLASGDLHIEYPPPLEHDGDEVGLLILRMVERDRIRRVVVDGIEPLQDAVFAPNRLPAFFAALVVRLRALGATTLLLKQIGKVVGPELDFSDTPLAGIAENLILLRHLELGGQLHRVISILNLRDSAFDAAVREFEIGAKGIRILEPIETVAGPLTGRGQRLGGDEG